MDDDRDLVARLKERRALMSVKDVAAEMGVHKQTIYDLLYSGSMPHVRVGSALRIDPVLLARWVASHSA